MVYRELALLVALATVPFGCATRPARESARWWPSQVVPKAVVKTTDYDSFSPLRTADGKTIPAPFGAEHMMMQSLAGLAAKAVNEGRWDEMVWIETSNADYRDWYRQTIERLALEERGTFAPWELVQRYAAAGIVKGYILYSYDTAERGVNQYTEDMDLSVNVATSVAGLLDAIIVEQNDEERVEQLGLTCLLDARGKTQAWCFETYGRQLNRRLLCCQDPKKPHVRALAVAQQALVLYGAEPPIRRVMAWLEPLSPILGWNGGDEFETTSLSSEFGHIQTATDWCHNLPLLMAGSAEAAPRPVRAFDPATIDWDDRRSATAFVLTDGDNVQWLMGGFFRLADRTYWNSPDAGRFPFTFSTCLTHLVQVCPAAADYAAASCPPLISLVEWGGGYYYPERFGQQRRDPDLLTRHARRTWRLMQQSGVDIIGFNFHDLRSPEALNAYRTYAREMDGLLAILAFQYYPYEGGAGEVFWVQDRHGVEVPVVTARYAIWENANGRPRSGTPAKIARLLNDEAAAAGRTGEQRLDWVICHSWSWFGRAPGADEDAENMSQADALNNGGTRGVAPTGWCVDRLSPAVRVVSVEELVWRLRMQHNPEQTRALLESRKAH